MKLNKLGYYERAKEYEHHYVYNGKKRTKIYLAHPDGTLTSKKSGRPMKKIIRESKLKSGTKVYQIQVRLPQKLINYSRVVASAYLPHFDITDLNQIIRFRNGNMFDIRPYNLYVDDKANQTKLLSSMQQKSVKYLRNHDKIRVIKIARLYGVKRNTIYRILRDEY